MTRDEPRPLERVIGVGPRQRSEALLSPRGSGSMVVHSDCGERHGALSASLC